MNFFFPHTGKVADWNTAYYRLEDYLRAHRIVNKLHQSQIILPLLERAAARHAREPERSPTTLALEEAHAAIEHWFDGLVRDEPPSRAASLGRTGLHLIDAHERWPTVFLSEQSLPSEFRREMQEITVKAGPELHVSSMVPRRVDSPPLVEILDETWEKLEGYTFFKTLLLGGGASMVFWLILF